MHYIHDGNFKEYNKRLAGFFRKHGVNDFETISELIGDTFVVYARKVHTLKTPEAFDAWLFKVAYFVYTDYLKKKGLQKNDGIEIVPDSDEEFPESPDDIENHLLIKEQWKIYLACLENLSDDLKETFKLRHHQERNIKEISTIMKINQGTVKSRISNARTKILDCVEKKRGKGWLK